MKDVLSAILAMGVVYGLVLWTSSPIGRALGELPRHRFSFTRALEAARSPAGVRSRTAYRWGGVLPASSFGLCVMGASQWTLVYGIVAGLIVGFLVWNHLTETALALEHLAAKETEPDE